MMPRLTEDDLHREYLHWVRQFGNARNQHDHRFGQHLHSSYILPEGPRTSADVFYEERARDAFDMIYENFMSVP